MKALHTRRDRFGVAGFGGMMIQLFNDILYISLRISTPVVLVDGMCDVSC